MATRLEKSLLKRLDELDEAFVERFDAYLEKIICLPPVFSVQQAASWQLPHVGELVRLLSEHTREMFAVGQAHGNVLVRELHKKYGKRKLADWRPSFRRLAVEVEPETFWLTPEGAIDELEKRSILLAGDVEGSISQAVKAIVLEHLRGAARPETEEMIGAALKSNRDRARLITTTETTYAYNRGRLSAYHENEVDYVRFSAVMDSRTSKQCRSRHGLVMRMDSGSLADNTPPLHGRCRSVLSPLYSAYQPELITPESTDWSKAAPLPKGWRTAA